MNFNQLSGQLGVVVNNNDPECAGRIQVCSPGEFDTAYMDKDIIPWAYPFNMSGYQTFSKMPEGSKVWLFKNNDGYDEYYYLPYFDTAAVTNMYLRDNYQNDPEIVFMRDLGGKVSSMTNDTLNGTVLSVNDASVQISQDSELKLSTPDASINIGNSKIEIGGNSGTYEPIVKGNALIAKLDELKNALSALSSACQKSSYTTHLMDPVNNCADTLNDLEQMLSTNSFVN